MTLEFDTEKLTPEQRAKIAKATGLDKTLARYKTQDALKLAVKALEQVRMRERTIRANVEAAEAQHRAQFDTQEADRRARFEEQMAQARQPLDEVEQALAEADAAHSEAFAMLEAAKAAEAEYDSGASLAG